MTRSAGSTGVGLVQARAAVDHGRPAHRLTPRVRGADAIEADPAYDDRQPAAHVFELGEVDACEPIECLLHGVLGLDAITKGARREREHVAAVLVPSRPEFGGRVSVWLDLVQLHGLTPCARR